MRGRLRGADEARLGFKTADERGPLDLKRIERPRLKSVGFLPPRVDGGWGLQRRTVDSRRRSSPERDAVMGIDRALAREIRDVKGRLTTVLDRTDGEQGARATSNGGHGVGSLR